MATSFTVPNLKPFTDYQFRLIAENVRGRGHPSEASQRFRTSPARPDRPPDRLFVEPLSSTELAIDWTPLRVDEWNGFILKFYYQIFGTSSDPESIHGQALGTDIFIVFLYDNFFAKIARSLKFIAFFK